MNERDEAAPLLPGAVRALRTADAVALAVASLIAGLVLIAWFVPALAEVLPDGWARMQRTTALSVLLVTAALALTRRPLRWRVVVGRALLAVVVGVAVLVLGRHLGGETSGLLDAIVAPEHGHLVATMSAQSAVAFLLVGLVALLPPDAGRPVGYVLDGLLLALGAVSLLYISGHIFRASDLLGSSETVLVSLQTTASIALLTLGLAARRAPFGFHAVLVRDGIGGHLARVVLPIAVVIAYGSAIVVERLLVTGDLSLTEVVATMSATLAVVLTVVVVLMARRILDMERSLRAMSVTDELTGLRNRRGFFVLAEQALRDARRTGTPLLLMYFDVDKLKPVNDTLGHEVGSRLLCDFARILRAGFRRNDVVGRLGGDEFALLAHGRSEDADMLLGRLRAATHVANAEGTRPYSLSFSAGAVALPPDSDEALIDALARADAAMYADKHAKRASEGQGGGALAGAELCSQP